MKKTSKARPKKIKCEFIVKSDRALSTQEEDMLVNEMSSIPGVYLDNVLYEE